MYNMYNTNYLGQSYVMGLRNKASMNFENWPNKRNKMSFTLNTNKFELVAAKKSF